MDLLQNENVPLFTNYNIITLIVFYQVDYKPLLLSGLMELLSYIITTLFNYVLHCFRFVWCPCMAINVSVQYNGGLLPDIILLTQSYYHRGTRSNAMKRFCLRSLWSRPNVLIFFPPDWGMLRRSRCVQIFL